MIDLWRTWLLASKCTWVSAHRQSLWYTLTKDFHTNPDIPTYCNGEYAGLGAHYIFGTPLVVMFIVATILIFLIMSSMKENDTMKRDDYITAGVLSLISGFIVMLLPVLWNFRPIIFTIAGIALWFYLVQRFADWLRHRAFEKEKWKIEKEPKHTETVTIEIN